MKPSLTERVTPLRDLSRKEEEYVPTYWWVKGKKNEGEEEEEEFSLLLPTSSSLPLLFCLFVVLTPSSSLSIEPANGAGCEACIIFRRRHPPHLPPFPKEKRIRPIWHRREDGDDERRRISPLFRTRSRVKRRDPLVTVSDRPGGKREEGSIKPFPFSFLPCSCKLKTPSPLPPIPFFAI